MSFASHPCFALDDPCVGITTMGVACCGLSSVLKAFPEAEEARLALGDPFNRTRNRRALSILSSLPPRTRVKILAADARGRS